jgi:hypothetical protein
MVAARLGIVLLASACSLLGATDTLAASSDAPVRGTDGADELAVAVRMRWARLSSGQSRALGLVTLTVPLDAAAALAGGAEPAGSDTRPTDALPDEARSARGRTREAAKPPGSGVSSPQGSSGHSEPTERTSPAIVLDPELARQTVRAALAAAGFVEAGRRLASLSTRARTSATLPQLRLRGGRSRDESLRLTPTTADPYRFTQYGGWELFFEVQLTWKLDRLVFSTAELSVERLRRTRARAKAQLAERVLKLLFAWQRARTRQAAAALLPHERQLAALEQLEAEVMLDVFTGGWFTARQGYQ